MKLKHLTIAPMMVACWLLAGSCALDDREVTLAISGLGIGGTSGAGPADGLLAPQLALSTEAIDLGWVTTSFSARARIRVDNLGTAPLPPPTVGFAGGSHPDFSLIQNGCALEVAPGKSCELRVQLVPSGNGERAATLEVRSDVGGEARVALSGQGLAAGDLILAPVAGSFEDFGGTRVGSSVEETFSISNPSDVASGPLRFRPNRPEFALLAPREGDCIPDQTSLVGGQSCTLRLAFTPTERGPLEATLTGASDGVGAVSVTLVGRGLLPAALSVSPPTVDFAGVVLSSSAQRSVLFENAGDEPLTLTGARLAPENAEGFSILNSNCGAGTQIEGGASCSVQLEFRPPRIGEELTAELLAEGAEGQAQSVPLRGIGLEQGALTVSATAPGDDDFGEVLLGESSERVFQIQNPSPQPSGVLDVLPSDGFTLAPPVEGAAGECVSGSTSLVDGETCSVRVLFAPSQRGPVTGSLTVSSPLAGATELLLKGQGIVPALLAVERELNFGRVLTGSSGVRTLTLANEGDQPLPPPSFELTGNAPAQVAAFSLESQCVAPLAQGETCDLSLTFAPTDATAHAVTLNISAMGINTSVLLLGEAQVPGSLVLSAADNVGAFGDVPIGTTTSRSFVLANPGQIPSGRVTVSSDNNQFAIDLGDCNQGDPAGLVDGASCTFNVRFTPADNLPQAANLSVQSPGAGRAGMQLSGRGRQSALLSSDTGNRDLGRANVGQDAIREPQNEFTWTVNNQGDLPTGTLTVQNGNAAEFVIRNDSCSNAAVPGRASCQMIIRFRPSAAGNRSARVVVTDPNGAPPATLALTGLGVQLAALGQSCVNAECSAGECTRGVCCNRACDRTCQVCSAQGQCIDQSNQEACGNGAACFGVDNCKLPAGRACSQNGGDAQCGSGQCERRLGGTGAGDRICCLDDCGNSLQCNGQNRCQAPTLGAGAACGAAGQLQCQTGLSCVDGVCCQEACGGYCERCQAGTGTCVAVPAGQQEADPVSGNNCTNGFECTGTRNGCRARTGQPCSSTDGSDCVSGNCEVTASGARICCSQNCAQGQFCNAQLQCVECNDGDARCVQGGGRQQCNNGFFQNANCPNGQTCVNNGQCGCGGNTPVACGNRCIRTDQCCDNNRCNACQQCNTNTNTCGPLGGQPDRCPGTQVCNATGQCVPPGAPNGSACNQPGDCESNVCTRWFLDVDGDGFGSQGPSGFLSFCGPNVPNVPGQRFVARADDCCDAIFDVRPGQTVGGEASYFCPAASARGGMAFNSFDYNCDGRQVSTEAVLNFNSLHPDCTTRTAEQCFNGTGDGSGWIDSIPDCGREGNFQTGCAPAGDGCSDGRPFPMVRLPCL
jgi:hypothetical protein